MRNSSISIKEKMAMDINDAITSGRNIKIQMDVMKDWNKYDVIINPEYIVVADDYVVIHSEIGSFYIDVMEIEYDSDDECWMCDGVDSSTYIWIC